MNSNCEANIFCLSYGCIIGWISPALSHLTTEHSPLTEGPLTTEQISWIGSIASIGALFGSIISSYITALFGCKKAMLLFSIPSTLFWFVILFTNTYYYLLFAEFLIGFSSMGCFANLILYIAEISNDR